MKNKEQYDNLLKLYKDYVKIFNNWETTKNVNVDYYNLDRLVRVFHDLTDLLLSANIIEKYGIKHYKVVESGEII